jgi:hypothetical protein
MDCQTNKNDNYKERRHCGRSVSVVELLDPQPTNEILSKLSAEQKGCFFYAETQPIFNVINAGAEAKLVLTMPCKEEEDHAQSPIMQTDNFQEIAGQARNDGYTTCHW